MKRLFGVIYAKLHGYCPKCGYKLGVWRDGDTCCYNCDLDSPATYLLKSRDRIN